MRAHFLIFRYNMGRKRLLYTIQSHSQKTTKSFTDYSKSHFFWYNYNVEAHFLDFSV